ncbi:hypothetical protein TCAL_16782 [Tigriopus californicus]|uniref:DUF7041 domain-containing protein n=1 Tax=Tigriopus californicus TaxID=6832 RepID=A0A553PRV0_TIGCA|nr:hypothetical protein TCAL_16782 [Tigriopus californicus]
MSQDESGHELGQLALALHAINAALVKIPSFLFFFLAFDPALWFVQVESTFVTGLVSNEETRLQHVLQHLDQRHLELMAWRIKHPDPAHPYTTFKQEFLDKTTKPKSAGLRECLSCHLGDQSPSELLSFMERMWPDTRADSESEAFQELFVMKLPCSIQERISQSGGALRDKALKANGEMVRIQQAQVDAATRLAPIFLTPKPSSPPFNKDSLYNLAQKKAKGIRQSGGGYLQENGQILCWYHARYDKQARQCRKYCARYSSKFQDKSSSSALGNEISARQ